MTGTPLTDAFRALIPRDNPLEVDLSMGFDRLVPSRSQPSATAESTPDDFPVLADHDQPPSDVLVELGLTPEQYIQRALGVHGGRLRQQAICTLTGWSPGTVSQALGEMESNGDITRFRDGREKIVCLPEAGPAGTQEPGQRTASDD